MTGTALATRAVPPAVLGIRRASHMVERNLLVYRHNWLILVSGFFEPIFYLFSMRVGLGGLVGRVPADGRLVSYSVFVAPALLAAAAMNGAIYESTMNVFHKLSEAKTYEAVLATPMGPRAVAAGEITFCLMRGSIYAVAFVAVMVAMGLTASWWAVLLLPTSVLVGFAFAAVGMAGTTFMRSWQDFDMVQVVMLPLFLFSATFYPVTTYPEALRWVVRATPLYQGVSLARAFSLGSVDLACAGHALYLLAMGAAGLAVAGKRIGKLLLK